MSQSDPLSCGVSSSSRKRKLTWTDDLEDSLMSSSPSSRASSSAAHDKGLLNDDVLEEVLAMCNGEIVPLVPNLQLFHYMLAYGHSDGSEGVCMDSMHRLNTVQCKIYERCIRFAAQHFSSATGNNHQSKFTPNEWIDTFCKLSIDADSGLPQIKKFAAKIASSAASPARSDSSSCSTLLGEVYSNEISSVASMFSNACQQCHGRRIVMVGNASSSPETCVDPYFPSKQLLSYMLSCCHEEEMSIRDDFIAWAVRLSEWVAEFYESCSLLSLDNDEGVSENTKKLKLLLPCRKRMGITDDEYNDWCSVTSSMSRRRVRCIREVIIPSIRSLATTSSAAHSSAQVIENVMTTCWKQLAMVNIEAVNMILFYISYTIRNSGENFVRLKLFSSSSPPLIGKQCDNNTNDYAMMLITSKVASVMRLSVPKISPLISIRMVQFSSGVYQLLAHGDECTTTRLLRSTFLLDQNGINGLQKVLRWVARGMVASVQGAKLIEDHFFSSSSSSSREDKKDGVDSSRLAVAVAQHAFREMLLRVVHFRSFGTGRRFVVDAVNLLLRTVGFELARKLMQISSNCVMTTEPDNEKSEALDCLVEVMAPWHCIMTMTSGGRICSSDGNARGPNSNVMMTMEEEDEAKSAAAVSALENEIMQASTTFSLAAFHCDFAFLSHSSCQCTGERDHAGKHYIFSGCFSL